MVHELFQVMWCCSQARPQEAEQTQKAWFCAVHSDFKLMLATCPVAPCLAPQEIPVSIYCVTSQWIFYCCAVLSCSLFTICPWVQMAWSKKACIVFFDEVDAIGGAQFDDGSGGGNEVQRTMFEIVNQLDGFDARGNIKVLMATNRYRFRH
jgi:hypothetical protein